MLIDFTEQFQNGYSGYERFLEILSVEPEIADKPDAKELTDVKGAITFEMCHSDIRTAWTRCFRGLICQ